MPIVGHSGADIIRQLIGNVVNIIKKKRSIATASCDGFVLKMHYQWTFWVLMAGFSCIWYSWYHRDVITCVSHFNADTQVRLDYINICLSYPYLEADDDGEDRRYLLYYRWIHFTLLVLAGFYYIPRKVSKHAENPRVKRLIEDLVTLSSRYDHTEREQVERAAKYLAVNLRTHNGIYFKFLACNFIALLVDILAFQFLDFVFQGRFLYYGWLSYPFQRQPENFTDYMSRTFPPFAKCELGHPQKLLGQRTEKFGCHLTVMELYEKVFLFIWIWLIVLTTVTCAYIIFLGFLWLPYFRLTILRVAKPPNAKDGSVTDTILNVLKWCKIGDVYVLYRLRQHLSHAKFYELLQRLNNPDMFKLMSIDPMQRLALRNNPDKAPRRQPMSIGGPKGKFNAGDFLIPNTSILVE